MAWRLVSAATNSRGVGFLRRKTNPFMKRKENNMIIARAAKGAALLLMIFGVVALIGCQAAATGPKGDPGPAGAAGPKGDTGAQGPAGISALQELGGTDPQLILINNVADEGSTNPTLLGNLASPSHGSLDGATYFSGGAPPVTYAGRTTAGAAIPDAGLEVGAFNVKVGNDGAITLAKAAATEATPDPKVTPVDADYQTGATFTIRATDANGVSRDRTMVVKANRAPRQVTPQYASPADQTLPTLPAAGIGVGADRMFYLVGTQPDLGDGSPGGDGVAWNTFESHRDTENSLVTANFQPNTGESAGYTNLFTDENHDELTVAITEIDAAGASDDEEHIMATLTEEGDLTVTGVKSTWNADRMTGSPPSASPAHEPVKVEITATDRAGLTAKSWIYVWVDGAPEVSAVGRGVLRDNYIVKLSDGPTDTLRSVMGFFSDPEATSVILHTTVSSSAELVATAALSSGNVQVTPVNQGTATITVYARAGRLPAIGAATRATQVDRNLKGGITADDGPVIPAAGGDNPAGEHMGYQYGTLTFQVTVIP